jgi:hypothetical protein
MLLLMRRVGEIVRINEKIALRIKEIHAASVTFELEDLSKSDQEEKDNSEINIKYTDEEKI